MLLSFVRAIVHSDWVAARGRVLLAAMIVIISIVGIFLMISAATIRNMPTRSAEPLQASRVKGVQEICADIWSGRRKPYLSFENWCAANRPVGIRVAR